MLIRPQYSVNHVLFEVWPYDPWSRKEIQKIMCELNVHYTEMPTTMGTHAFKFEQTDYQLLIKALEKL